MKFYFSRRTQLDKHLGQQFKFESAEFGVEAETKELAEKGVKEWMDEFFKKCKETLEQQEKNKIPFKGDEFTS